MFIFVLLVAMLVVVAAGVFEKSWDEKCDELKTKSINNPGELYYAESWGRGIAMYYNGKVVCGDTVTCLSCNGNKCQECNYKGYIVE